MTKKQKELLADRAAARYYVGNLLVYAKALNTELCQLGFRSKSANDYGMQIMAKVAGQENEPAYLPFS